MTETITFSKQRIGPEDAEVMLRLHNDGNRRLRVSAVNRFARDMIAGNWRVVHQCIAFDRSGHLIDGQHRLAAIVQSGVEISMYVARYHDCDRTMQLPIDLQSRRSADDILKCGARDAEVCNVLIKMAGRMQGGSPSEIAIVLQSAGMTIRRVICASPTGAKHRTAAATRAAVVARCWEDPDQMEEIVWQYSKFARLEQDGVWPSVIALMKTLDRSAFMQTMELGCKAYQAFSPNRRHTMLSRLSDTPRIASELRRTARAITHMEAET